MPADCDHTSAQHEAQLIAHNDQSRARITDWIIRNVEDNPADWRTTLDVLAALIAAGAADPDGQTSIDLGAADWSNATVATLVSVASVAMGEAHISTVTALAEASRDDVIGTFVAVSAIGAYFSGKHVTHVEVATLLNALRSRERAALAVWGASALTALGFSAETLAALAGRADHVMASAR